MGCLGVVKVLADKNIFNINPTNSHVVNFSKNVVCVVGVVITDTK